ncbi:MAG: acetyl-CoA carboxylase, carboxyltransferase subunit beta [bacterium]
MPKSIADWFQSKKKKDIRETEYKAEKLDIPGDVWVKCYKCGEVLYNKDLAQNLKVCSSCGYHFKLTYRERLDITADPGTFKEIDTKIHSTDFLNFRDSKPYAQRIIDAEKKSGLNDAIITGTAKIGNIDIALGIMDFGFMGGSMGSVVGEKVTRLVELAMAQNLPVVIFTSSGGARMQEGIMSLMQMAKTSAAFGELAKKNLPYICVLVDPTTGGTTASFAMLGDVHISEPGALIGFAGPRVIEQTIKQKLPTGFQRAEFLQEHGMVDMVVPRKGIKETIIKFLEFCSSANKGAKRPQAEVK